MRIEFDNGAVVSASDIRGEKGEALIKLCYSGQDFLFPQKTLIDLSLIIGALKKKD